MAASRPGHRTGGGSSSSARRAVAATSKRSNEGLRVRLRRALPSPFMTLRDERRRQPTAEADAHAVERQESCLVARAETVSITAPPRPPRQSDPVDREELEALVEALIEEARQRAQRRRRRNAAVVTLIALVGVALFAVLGRSAQSQTASRALSARSIAPAQAGTSRIAFFTGALSPLGAAVSCRPSFTS